MTDHRMVIAKRDFVEAGNSAEMFEGLPEWIKWCWWEAARESRGGPEDKPCTCPRENHNDVGSGSCLLCGGSVE